MYVNVIKNYVEAIVKCRYRLTYMLIVLLINLVVKILALSIVSLQLAVSKIFSSDFKVCFHILQSTFWLIWILSYLTLFLAFQIDHLDPCHHIGATMVAWDQTQVSYILYSVIFSVIIELWKENLNMGGLSGLFGRQETKLNMTKFISIKMYFA
jgi:hypothetical protein